MGRRRRTVPPTIDNNEEEEEEEELQDEPEECSYKSTRIPYVDPKTSKHCLIVLQHAYKTFDRKSRYKKVLHSTLAVRAPGVRAPLCSMMDKMIRHAEKKLRDSQRDENGNLLKRQIVIHSSSDITDFDFDDSKSYATKLNYSFELRHL